MRGKWGALQGRPGAVLIATLALLALIPGPGNLAAAQGTEPSSGEGLAYPATLSLSAIAGEATAASGTFTITTGTAVTGLTFTPGTLADASTGETVAGASLAVEPARIDTLDPGPGQQVTVRVDAVPGAGTYTATIAIAYEGQPEGADDAISVTLAVAAAQPEIEDLPGEVVLNLIKKEDGTYRYRGVLRVTASGEVDVANVRLINLLPMALVGSEVGRPILETQISVDPADGVTLAPGETAAFDIQVEPPVRTGTYQGLVEVAFDNRPGDAQAYLVDLLLIAEPAEVHVTPADGVLVLLPEAEGGSYKASFTLTLKQGGVGQILFTDHPLDRTGAAGQPYARIAADRVSVDTGAEGEAVGLDAAQPERTFTVEVTRPTAGFAPGTYEGPLLVSMRPIGAESQPAFTRTLTLRLTVDAPVVTITPADRQVVLRQARAGDPYRATFLVGTSQGTLSGIRLETIGLDQADGEGHVDAAEIKITPEASTVTLDADSGSVAFSIEVQQRQTGNFAAGTYEGTLAMTYAGGGEELLALKLLAQPDATVAWSRHSVEGAKAAIKANTRDERRLDITLLETGKVSDAQLTAIAVQDLQDPDDASRSLPLAVLGPVWPDGEAPTIAAEGSHTVTLPFDFRRDGVRPGAYSGFVRVESENAETVRIPLEITLRAPFLWGAFAVFVLGAVLGYALHLYRSKYRERLQTLDAIETQEELLNREQSGAGGRPTVYYEFYGETGSRKLEAAKRLLRDAGWEGNVATAKGLVDTVRGWQARWAEHQDAFCEAWGRLQGLRSEFDAGGKYADPDVMAAAPRYLPARRDALDTIAGQLHTYATGEDLQQAIDAEAQRLGRFDGVWNQMARIQVKIEALAPDKQPPLQERLNAQRTKLAGADTDEDVAAISGELAPLEKDVDAAPSVRALALDVPPDIEPGFMLYDDGRAVGGDIDGGRGLEQRLGSAVRTIWEDPDTWLFAFGLLAHVVAFAGLVALGYEYWNNQATFGKEGFDYISLFFVGFAGISTTNTLISSALTPFRGWILQQQGG